MPFVPNIHFTILIKIDGRLREFNFRKRTADIYDADTSDDRGNRWLFKWRKTSDGWQMEPGWQGLPTWIYDNHSVIASSFDQYIAQSQV